MLTLTKERVKQDLELLKEASRIIEDFYIYCIDEKYYNQIDTWITPTRRTYNKLIKEWSYLDESKTTHSNLERYTKVTDTYIREYLARSLKKFPTKRFTLGRENRSDMVLTLIFIKRVKELNDKLKVADAKTIS